MKRIPPRVRRLVYNKFDGRCAYCGQPIEFKDMQVDHIKPALHRWSDEDRITCGNALIANANSN